MTKSIIMTALIILIAISAILVFKIGATGAEEAVDTSDISAKLDEVLKNQKAILSDMESIKAELGIIKIRITQQQ